MRRCWALAVAALALTSACTGPDDRPSPPSGAAPPGPPTPDPSAGLVSWRQLAAAPSQRTEVAAAASADGRIYVIAGYGAGGGSVSTVDVLDTATGRWSAGPSLPLAVNHAMATSVRGTVHVFGGYFARTGVSPAAFRLEGGAWQAIAPMPDGRGAGTAVAVGDTVYVAGGINSRNSLAEEMLVYDVPSGTWSTAPGPPTRREHLGGAASGGLVYVIGGRTAGGNLAAVEVYDPGTRSWTTVARLPTARGGLAAAATCTGQVVAVGGEADQTFPQVEAYDPATRSWTALPELPTPRHGLGVVVVGSTLYALSGGPRPGLVLSDTAEAIDLAPLGACR